MLKKIITVGTFVGMALLLSACNQAGTSTDATTGDTTVAPADATATAPNTTDTSTTTTTTGATNTQSKQP